MSLPERCVVCGRLTGGCCTVMVVTAAWLDAQTHGTILCACGRLLRELPPHPDYGAMRRVVSYDRCDHHEPEEAGRE